MKILLANKYYYHSGGDCIYTMNLEQLLKAHGHEVAVFAMQYPENDLVSGKDIGHRICQSLVHDATFQEEVVKYKRLSNNL